MGIILTILLAVVTYSAIILAVEYTNSHNKNSGVVKLKVRRVESYKTASTMSDLAIFQDKDSLEIEFKYNPKYQKQDMMSTKRLIGYVKKSDMLEFLSKIER